VDDSITVEEESIPGIGGNNEVDGYSYTTTGTFANNATWGPDGFGGIVSVNGVSTIVAGFITVSDAAGTLKVNASTGDYTYTLNTNLLQAGAGENTETAPSFAIVGKDADGSTIGFNLNVSVIDDIPVLNLTNGIVQNSTHSVLNGTLASMGADLIGSDVNLTSISAPAGLSSNGHALTYATSPDGSTITATDSVTSAVVFTMQASSDGTYTFTQNQILDLSVLTSNLQSTVGAGGPQPAYYLYADGTFGSVENAKDWAVKITGNNDINPSTQGMGVGNNLFQGGETMHFEFDDEHASSVGGTTPNLAYMAKITFNDLDAGESVAYSGKYLDGSSFSGSATTLTTVNGVLTITAPTGQYIDYIDFAPSAGTSVRMTGVSTFVVDDTKTQSISFGYNAIDGDGDMVSSSVTLTVQNSHTLMGTLGNDALAGGTGSDILVGGQGDDILTGGLGADTFKWNSGDHTGTTSTGDKITDFSVAQGDVLDLAGMLQGESANTASLVNYLSFAKIGSDTVLTIDVNGATTGTAGQTITFQGVDLTAGGTLTNAQIIQNLLDGHNLKTDA